LKKLFLLTSLLFIASSTLVASESLKGSGASFPYSVYTSWINKYYQETGIKIEYISKGSSKGIEDAKLRAVDFAGTDKPLNEKQLSKYKLFQFPAIVGAIALGYNLPGIKKLNISRKALIGIVEGKVLYWDNPLIQKDNPTIKLPHKSLTFVHRSDGSGTTYNFTYYLSEISKSWHDTHGAKKMISWPMKHKIGAKRNSGIAKAIENNSYTIGYLDYSDAKHNNINMASLENKQHFFVAPTPQNFQTAAKEAIMNARKCFYSVIVNPKGEQSYPIIAATFILLPKEKKEINSNVVKFFKWSFSNGTQEAKNLGYIPIPKNLSDLVQLYLSCEGYV